MATPPVFSAGAVLTAAQMNKIGMWFITSATAANTSTTLGINSCFSSDYVNYVIYWNGKAANNDVSLSLKLRASGTPVSTGYRYVTQQQYVGIGAIGLGGSNSATLISLGSISSTETFYTMTIANPYAALPTYVFADGVNNQTAFSNGIDAYKSQGFLQNTTSYDGFEIISGGGNLTGTLYVYGCRV